jgi:hypothetical protein
MRALERFVAWQAWTAVALVLAIRLVKEVVAAVKP